MMKAMATAMPALTRAGVSQDFESAAMEVRAQSLHGGTVSWDGFDSIGEALSACVETSLPARGVFSHRVSSAV